MQNRLKRCVTDGQLQRIFFPDGCIVGYLLRRKPGGIRSAPRRLLNSIPNVTLLEVPEGDICCGSAGTYNLLQPRLAGELGHRKAGTLEAVEPQVVAAGNIGCMMQIGARTSLPVVHTAELLDWATGGPKPRTLEEIAETSP